jgi:hypothetical protein
MAFFGKIAVFSGIYLVDYCAASSARRRAKIMFFAGEYFT